QFCEGLVEKATGAPLHRNFQFDRCPGSVDDPYARTGTVPTRIGAPERIGGSDQLPTWRLPLSENPTPEWRRRFLQVVHADGLCSGPRTPVEARPSVLEAGRPSSALVFNHTNRSTARAPGDPPPAVPAQASPSILVVDDDPEIGPLAMDILESQGYAL